jgi:ribosomal protein S18 acetylase RimI-like enzyme
MLQRHHTLISKVVKIMAQLDISNAKSAETQIIARLIAAVNSDPAHHCLHCDQEEEGVLEEIKMLEIPMEESFVVARDGERIVGVLGADLTLERDRAWLWGPFVAGADWVETAEALLTHLTTKTHPQLKQLNQFLNAANEQGLLFFLEQGFEEIKTSHVYQALPPVDAVEEPNSEIAPPQWRSFIDLHEKTFPTTYFSGREIIERLGKQNKVFVEADEENVLGYVYANVEPTEGFIHFLAVQQKARGQGIGKRLLTTAVSWLFNNQKAPQIGLVVDDENNARQLYERCGFELLHTGVGLRKEIG